MLRASVPTEFDEQVDFLRWFELRFPGVRIFAIPNGTRASIRASMKAKREGVKKGVPDLFIPKLMVWIEMKRVKGSTISPEQRDWHHYLEKECGHKVIVGMGWEDASRKLMAHIESIGQ